MPPRKPKTYKKKRSYRRKSKWNATMGSPNNPLATKILSKQVYVDTQTLQPTTAVAGVRVYSLNGLYDPDITGTGHQPRGFDQLASLYNHYVVIGAKVSCSFTNSDSVNPQIVGLAIRASSNAEADWNDYVEQGHCQYRMISDAGGSRDTTTLGISGSPAKYLGRSKVMSDPALKGDASANPTEQFYLHVFGAAVDGADSQGIRTILKIEYASIFIEPKDLVQS